MKQSKPDTQVGSLLEFEFLHCPSIPICVSLEMLILIIKFWNFNTVKWSNNNSV